MELAEKVPPDLFPIKLADLPFVLSSRKEIDCCGITCLTYLIPSSFRACCSRITSYMRKRQNCRNTEIHWSTWDQGFSVPWTEATFLMLFAKLTPAWRVNLIPQVNIPQTTSQECVLVHFCEMCFPSHLGWPGLHCIGQQLHCTQTDSYIKPWNSEAIKSKLTLIFFLSWWSKWMHVCGEVSEPWSWVHTSN